MNRLVWSDGLVLPVDKDPETEFAFRDLEVCRNPLLESEELFVLQDAEGRELSWRKVLVVERSEIEALVTAEDIVGNDFGSEVEVLFVFFSSLRLDLLSLLVQTHF